MSEKHGQDPNEPAEIAFEHKRHGPSSVTEHHHGTQHTYHHDHPAMGGLHHGAKAKHPYHDGEQEHYEDGHGYNGGHGGPHESEE